FWKHWHTPPQSAPPALEVQPPVGSSTHLPIPGHLIPPRPPQRTLGMGGGLHAQVGQPLASSTLPYSQKMSQTGPHMGGLGTHLQTAGELSNRVPCWHAPPFELHWQMPPQSAPPLFGSQSSLGSSTHSPPPGHRMPAMPPQATDGVQSCTLSCLRKMVEVPGC